MIDLVIDLLKTSKYETIESALRSLDINERDKILTLISEIINTPVFLIGIWEEGAGSNMKKKLEVLNEVKVKLNKINEPRENLKKIINNESDFGRVLMPTKLLRNLWTLGQIIDQFLKSKQVNDEYELVISDIMRDSAEWVRYSNERWPEQETSVQSIPLESPPF